MVPLAQIGSQSCKGRCDLGIQGGSLSLCRYRLLGAGTRRKLSELNSLIAKHSLGPVLLKGTGREEEAGWVRPVGLDKLNLPPNAPWDLSSAELEEGFLLRLRILRRQVPGPLLQLVYRQRFFEHEEKTGKAPGPKERRDLRDSIKAELLARALPSITHIDAFWRDAQGELLVFSTSAKALEIFERLFGETFAKPLGQTLVRIEPPLLGLPFTSWADEDEAQTALRQLAQTAPAAFTEDLYP